MMARAERTVLRGTWLEREPLAGYTSWHIGGPADRLYLPADVDDLRLAFGVFPDSDPVFWLGLGSNLLIRDGGLRGTVVCTRKALTGLEYLGADRVRAEAGVACAKVARFCAKHDLAGAEFLAGIPGSIGGAVAMNAGAWGGETWPCIEAVETIDRAGTLRERPPGDFRYGYRWVSGPAGEWFTAATMRFEHGDGEAARARIRELLTARSRSQPMGTRNCGSVFRNPPGDHAARLIESLGLKGYAIGGAQVSPKHANFIINRGDATAADVERLIEHVRATVRRECGIDLQPEVQIVGEPA